MIRKRKDNLKFGATLRELRAMGKQVDVWEPLPGGRFSVPEAMARNEMGGRQMAIDFTREEHLKEFGFLTSLRVGPTTFRARSRHRVSCAGRATA